jgi:hypothetical protein
VGRVEIPGVRFAKGEVWRKEWVRVMRESIARVPCRQAERIQSVSSCSIEAECSKGQRGAWIEEEHLPD